MKIIEVMISLIERTVVSLVYYLAPILFALVVGIMVGMKAISLPCATWAGAELQMLVAIAVVYVFLRIMIQVLFDWTGLDDLVLFL